jgi:predicted acylesterase/phospholipase RssA
MRVHPERVSEKYRGPLFPLETGQKGALTQVARRRDLDVPGKIRAFGFPEWNSLLLDLLRLSPAQLFDRTYTRIVFAGGGNRCWWQGGMAEALSAHACWSPERFIGTSAGASMATAVGTGNLQKSLRKGVAYFNTIPRNVEWSALLRGRRPFIMPNVFHTWVESFLDEQDLARLGTSALRIDVVVTRLIPRVPILLSAGLALGIYATEKLWHKGIHGRLPDRVGFRAEHHELNGCESLSEAHNLLLSAGSALPLTPLHHVKGRPALDGGFHDNIPLPLSREHDAQTLVLLTRHRPDWPQIFEHRQRVYLQPKRAVSAGTLDFTSGTNIQLTCDQGRQEGKQLLASRASAS